jgi:hypothetical protein
MQAWRESSRANESETPQSPESPMIHIMEPLALRRHAAAQCRRRVIDNL